MDGRLTDGIKGIESFNKYKEKIDLVLLDLVMPNMDGEKTFKALKKINKDANIIFMSGIGQFDKLKKTFKDDSFQFIIKPFKLQEISEIISNVLIKNNP